MRDAPPFYYAEDYHQQYLAKNPGGYCGIGGTGVSCPAGVDIIRAAMSRVTYTNTPDRIDQEAVRASHGVRIVTEREEGTGVNALPGGVYGYTYSPGLPNAPLFAARRYPELRDAQARERRGLRDCVRRRGDGAADRRLAPPTSRCASIPSRRTQAAVLVKIPYSRIRQHRQYAAPNQDGFLVTRSASDGHEIRSHGLTYFDSTRPALFRPAAADRCSTPTTNRDTASRRVRPACSMASRFWQALTPEPQYITT